jgi:flagellar biosynthetic protein FlhB
MALIERPYDFRLNVGADAILLLATVGSATSVVLALPLVVLMIFGIMVSLLQNPLRFVGNRIKPELSRISPAKGFTRMFGPQGRVEFLKSIFKLTILTACAIAFLANYKADLVNSILLEPAALPQALARQLLNVLVAVGLSLAGVVAADLIWSRIKWRMDLRMSKQEVKDEHKRSEGDPHVKGQIRQRQMAMSRNRMMADLPKADVVMVNPTHVAVALRYDPDKGAPRVIAKGAGAVATKIREAAMEHRIPLVQDVPLARALYAGCEVGQEIPPDFYGAVAKVLAFVMGLKAKGAATGVHRNPTPSKVPAPTKKASQRLAAMAAA